MKNYYTDFISIIGTEEEFLKAIQIDTTPDFRQEALDLFNSAAKIAKPKGLFRKVKLSDKKAESVMVDGYQIDSKIMVSNAYITDYCFAFLATCGHEIDEWSAEITDPLKQFWAEKLRQHLLYCAFKALREKLEAEQNPGKNIVMTPGSLVDWPLQDLETVFALLKDGPQKLNVDLSSSFLMIPTKSLSGFIIPTDKEYINCKVCARLNCPDRHADFEEDYTF